MQRAVLVLGIVSAVALAGAGASASSLGAAARPAAAGPVTWQAHVGAQASDEALQALAFFPPDVFVNVGDSITWSFDTAEPHTVTFEQGGQAPTSTTPSGGSFDGTNVINSGTIIGPGKQYSVVFTGQGDFTYLCLIHAKTMSARVHVNPAGSPYPHSQGEYDRQTRSLSQLDLQDAADIRADNLDAARDAGRDHVITGGGDAQVFVARFLPAVQHVRLGETVVWSNPDSVTPHTVTLGPTPSNAAVGLDSPGHATISSNPVTSTISSGLIGIRRPNGMTFEVTFNAAGTFSYFCSLHRDLGMTGTIVVSGGADRD